MKEKNWPYVKAYINGETLTSTLDSSDKLLGVGGGGAAKICRKPAAVKLWNGAQKEFQPLIGEEIVTCCRLATDPSLEHGEVMGEAVPELSAVSLHSRVLVLLSEVVGCRVHRVKGGDVTVDDVV